MQRRRAIMVTEGYTVTDETAHPTPDDAFGHGLGAFLSRIGARFDTEGVVLLDEAAAARLSLPTTRAQLDAVTELDPAAQDARRAGWQLGHLSDWTSFYADGRPSINVGIIPLIDLGRFPLWSTFPADTVAGLALWHELSGSAWFGTPGLAGMAIMRRLATQLVPPKMRKSAETRPTWKPKDPGPTDAFEDDYRREHWRGPTSAPYAHGWDANRAYVAAAGNVILAPFSLRPTGRIRFDRNRAGWWQCELPRWNDPRMPDPAGYAPGTQYDSAGKCVRWISTTRLELLEYLTGEGVYGGARILDSVTAPGVRLLEPVKDVLRDIFDGGTRAGGEANQAAMERAAKDCGHELFGFFKNARNWIYRPDWWYSIVAMSACTQWRKAWNVGLQFNLWPQWFDVDNVWYGSESADPALSKPPGYKIDSGQKLGYVKHNGTLRRKTR